MTATLASTTVATPKATEPLLIGGAWRSTSRTFPVVNPATGEVIAHVADATRADAREAVEAAQAAFTAWAATPAIERARVLRRAEALMLQRADALALTLTREGGKPVAEARGEIAYAASFVGWFAGEAERMYGRVIPASTPAKRLMALRQPVGVVGAITPVELPRGNGHAKGRAGDRGRLHGRAKARGADASYGPRARRESSSRPAFRPASGTW